MRSQTTRTIGGRVNSDGTVAVAGAFAARKIATGKYVLTFPDGFRLAGIGVTPYNAGNTIYYIENSTMTEKSVQFQFAAATTSGAQDAGFTFVATGAA